MADKNTCFIDPESGKAYSHHWSYLKRIQKVTFAELDQLDSSTRQSSTNLTATNKSSSETLEISLDNQIWLNREKLSPVITKYIRDELNFINSDYLMKKKMGRNTW